MINYDQQVSPLEVYLNRMTSIASRRAMRQALDSVARFISSDESYKAEQVEWHRLRHAHTHKVRNWLAETYQVSTANRIKAGGPCEGESYDGL